MDATATSTNTAPPVGGETDPLGKLSSDPQRLESLAESDRRTAGTARVVLDYIREQS